MRYTEPNISISPHDSLPGADQTLPLSIWVAPVRRPTGTLISFETSTRNHAKDPIIFMIPSLAIVGPM